MQEELDNSPTKYLQEGLWCCPRKYFSSATTAGNYVVCRNGPLNITEVLHFPTVFTYPTLRFIQTTKLLRPNIFLICYLFFHLGLIYSFLKLTPTSCQLPLRSHWPQLSGFLSSFKTVITPQIHPENLKTDCTFFIFHVLTWPYIY